MLKLEGGRGRVISVATCSGSTLHSHCIDTETIKGTTLEYLTERDHIRVRTLQKGTTLEYLTERDHIRVRTLQKGTTLEYLTERDHIRVRTLQKGTTLEHLTDRDNKQWLLIHDRFQRKEATNNNID